MRDLYEILGVARDARTDTIHRAYRGISKTKHPDVGGDPDEWAELLVAKSVLMDPAARALYDKTGEVHPPKADTSMARVLEVLSRGIQQYLQMDQDILAVDLVESLKVDITNMKNQAEEFATKAKRGIDRAAELSFRFQTDKETNEIANLVAFIRERLELGVQKANEDIVGFDAAIKFLDDYTFAYKIPITDPQSATSAADNNTSFGTRTI